VQGVGQNSSSSEQLTSTTAFIDSLFGQVNIDPTGEQILLIPLAFAMAKQDQGRCNFSHDKHCDQQELAPRTYP
jgi:hypothetical protein